MEEENVSKMKKEMNVPALVTMRIRCKSAGGEWK